MPERGRVGGGGGRVIAEIGSPLVLNKTTQNNAKGLTYRFSFFFTVAFSNAMSTRPNTYLDRRHGLLPRRTLNREIKKPSLSHFLNFVSSCGEGGGVKSKSSKNGPKF